jgi:hypothetical protein
MNRVSGYQDKRIADDLSKEIGGKVRKNKIKIFGKLYHEWAVYK